MPPDLRPLSEGSRNVKERNAVLRNGKTPGRPVRPVAYHAREREPDLPAERLRQLLSARTAARVRETCSRQSPSEWTITILPSGAMT